MVLLLGGERDLCSRRFPARNHRILALMDDEKGKTAQASENLPPPSTKLASFMTAEAGAPPSSSKPGQPRMRAKVQPRLTFGAPKGGAKAGRPKATVAASHLKSAAAPPPPPPSTPAAVSAGGRFPMLDAELITYLAAVPDAKPRPERPEPQPCQACPEAVAVLEFLSLYHDLPALSKIKNIPRTEHVHISGTKHFTRIARTMLDAVLSDMDDGADYPERWTRLCDEWTWPEILRRWCAHGVNGAANRRQMLDDATIAALRLLGSAIDGVGAMSVRQRCAVLACLADDIADTEGAADYIDGASARAEEVRRTMREERSAHLESLAQLRATTVSDPAAAAEANAETQRQEESWVARCRELEVSLRACETRAVPLGTDRDGRAYYSLLHAQDRIYVEESVDDDKMLGSYPVTSIDQLILWLDDRGVNERALKHELVAIRKRVTDASRAVDGQEAMEADSEEEEEEDSPRHGSTSRRMAKCVDRSCSILFELIGLVKVHHAKHRDGGIPAEVTYQYDAWRNRLRSLRANRQDSASVVSIAAILRQIEEHVHELFGLLNSKAKADQYDDSEEDRMESVDDDDGEGISTVEPDEANMDRICADQW